MADMVKGYIEYDLEANTETLYAVVEATGHVYKSAAIKRPVPNFDGPDRDWALQKSLPEGLSWCGRYLVERLK